MLKINKLSAQDVELLKRAVYACDEPVKPAQLEGMTLGETPDGHFITPEMYLESQGLPINLDLGRSVKTVDIVCSPQIGGCGCRLSIRQNSVGTLCFYHKKTPPGVQCPYGRSFTQRFRRSVENLIVAYRLATESVQAKDLDLYVLEYTSEEKSRSYVICRTIESTNMVTLKIGSCVNVNDQVTTSLMYECYVEFRRSFGSNSHLDFICADSGIPEVEVFEASRILFDSKHCDKVHLLAPARTQLLGMRLDGKISIQDRHNKITHVEDLKIPICETRDDPCHVIRDSIFHEYGMSVLGSRYLNMSSISRNYKSEASLQLRKRDSLTEINRCVPCSVERLMAISSFLLNVNSTAALEERLTECLVCGSKDINDFRFVCSSCIESVWGIPFHVDKVNFGFARYPSRTSDVFTISQDGALLRRSIAYALRQSCCLSEVPTSTTMFFLKRSAASNFQVSAA